MVLGAGRSGQAAAKLARRQGASVRLCDSGSVVAELGEGIESVASATELWGATQACDLLVVSPGIDTYGPYVAAFAQHAGEVIGEVELAARCYTGKIVGITGTNGKTTTTELVARILHHAGLGGDACGNYGVPFAEVVMKENVPAAVALELSSFQLETIRELRPEVAIWLNFAPDHMDRYPTVEAYFEAKARIFENQTSGDCAVVRAGEKLPNLRAKLVSFSTESADATWYSDGISLFFEGKKFAEMERVSRLRGLHNAENLLAAFAAGHALGISLESMQQALAGYAPLPHRCEWVRTLDEVEYLNDSKATNLHALESALRSQTRPVVLIAGGKEKGLDYEPLLQLLGQKAIGAVTFGQIAQPLGKLFSRAIATESVETLEEAVALARSMAIPGSMILFSPGTSSFDQFKGYEDRGEKFRQLVLQLPSSSLL